ncbi:MAG: hypothetical protein QNJ23_05020 [Woeseiaceae bacterium]|nr:hypothetical protein [Woeseiaceae bacterium]
MSRNVILLPLCVFVLAACKHLAPDADQPAVIVNPSDASRAALQATVNNALGKDVMLAGDALTDTSILIIERRIPSTIEGSPAKGMAMEDPVRFTLMSNGVDCVLVDERDGSRYLLADTECKAEDGQPPN